MTETFSPPRYHRIRAVLRERIARGEYLPHQRIPSEAQLCREFGVSRGTVERAIRGLVEEGVLYRVQGKGTFVASPPLDEVSFRLGSIWEEARRAGRRLTNRVIRQAQMPATPEAAQRLGIPPGHPVIEIVRLRLIDDLPIAHESRTLALELCPQLLEEDVETQSIHDLLLHKYRLPLLKASYTIEVVVLEGPEAELLEAEPGTPAFLVDRLTYTTGLRPAVWLRQLFRGDRYRFVAEIAPLGDRGSTPATGNG